MGPTNYLLKKQKNKLKTGWIGTINFEIDEELKFDFLSCVTL